MDCSHYYQEGGNTASVYGGRRVSPSCKDRMADKEGSLAERTTNGKAVHCSSRRLDMIPIRSHDVTPTSRLQNKNEGAAIDHIRKPSFA